MKKKVLVIGWDAADWNLINPLIEKGKMPALAGLIKKGVKGNLSTMNPPYSPMLWTSVATGKTPDKHGVLGFIEIDSEQQIVRPVTVSQRKVKAIWNILNSQGMKSNLVGWWPSHPAEPINGVIVSDTFPKPIDKFDAPWPLAKDSVHPKSMAKEILDLRMHPQELTGAHILPFIPKAKEIEEQDQKSLHGLAKMVSHNSTIHAVSTYLMDNTQWDFMGVYYDMIDHFCHAFMKFYPPKLPAVPQKQFDIYKEAVDGAYMFQDMMLERTLELIDEDTLVVVMSDHGYVSDNNRMLVIPEVLAAPALEHREFGMIVMSGPGVKKGQTIYGASLLDITPTLLNYLDVPIGQDMDGRVLSDAFIELPPKKMIDSWENQVGDFGEHDRTFVGDPMSQQSAMEQLIELGYIDRPNADMEKAIHSTKCDLRFNLARVYLAKEEYDKCEEILMELIQEDVTITSYLVDLIHLNLIKEDYKAARKYLMLLREKDPKSGLKTKITEAKILIGEGMVQKARVLLEEVSKRTSMAGATHFELGKLYLRLRETHLALEQFKKAVEFKSDSAKYHHAMATTFLLLDDPMNALDHALTSVELVRYFPDAHYTLGRIFEKLNDPENAKRAFETAETLRPTMNRATLAKENLEQDVKGNKEKVIKIHSVFEEIVVVSGLPRSGTSMMMQMLSAGGIAPLTDGNRKEDESNPKGYFEYEKTKSLHKNNDWIHEAENKVVKVVAPLLKFLPKNYRYKIVFMTRDLDEVLASQDRMLNKRNAQPKVGVRDTYQLELKRLDKMIADEPGFEVLKVAYADVVENPQQEASRIAIFLGKDLDQTAMIDAVEAKLYRNRSLKL